MTSSIYSTTLLPTRPLKAMSIFLCKFSLALIKPKGIIWYENVPHFVLKVILNWSSSNQRT
jgi:hypothetical protein